MNIQEAINTSLIELERSENTIRTYRMALKIFAEELKEKWVYRVEDLSVQNFIDYALQTSHRAYAKSTAQTYIAGVDYFLQWLMLRDLIHPTPNDLARFEEARKSVNRKRQKHLLRVPPSATIEKLLEAVKNQDVRSPQKERDIAIILFLKTSGCRNEDVCNLLVSDVELSRKRVLIRSGKGDKDRFAYFSSETAQAIQDYWTARGWSDPNDPAFARHDKRNAKFHAPLTTESIRNIVRDLCKLAGVENVTPHSFRHYFVTQVLRKTNGNLALAKDLAGHENISTTRSYAEFLDDEIQAGYNEVFD